jgi:hypothetical protein
VASPKREAPADAERTDKKKSSLWFEGRALGQVLLGRGPEAQYAVTPTLGLGLQSSSLVEPLARLGATVSLPKETSQVGGTATFQLVVGRVELCPLRVPLADWLRLRLCAVGEGGALRASGGGLDVTNSVTVPVFSTGGTATLELTHGSGLGLELGGGASAELLRSKFELGGQEVYGTPGISAAAFAGLRWDSLKAR